MDEKEGRLDYGQKRDRDWKTREDNDGNWEGWTVEWEKGGRGEVGRGK